MLRDRLRTRRDEFLSFVLPRSDPANNVHIVDPRTGAELTVYRSRTGHELGLAAYPAAGRALYRVKVAHALVLGFATSLALLASAQVGHAGPDSSRLDTHGMRRDLKAMTDPFPVAAVAEERENHAEGIARPGHPVRCLALVSTRDDGRVLVTLATAEGLPFTSVGGPYPSEKVGVADMIGTYGRDC